MSVNKHSNDVCLLLIGCNLFLLVYLLFGKLVDNTYGAIAVLILIGLAVAGIVGIIKQKRVLVYTYSLISLIPAGFYLLLNPFPYQLIGFVNLIILILQLIKDSRRFNRCSSDHIYSRRVSVFFRGNK